jgi:hypothetical protein
VPDRELTAGDRVEWLHVVATGRAFVISIRSGRVRRVSGTAVFVTQEGGKPERLPAADLAREGAIYKTSSNF